MNDDTDLGEVVDILKLVDLLIGLGFSAFFIWMLFVPESFKIDLRAWWNTHMKPVERDRRIAQLKWNLVELESIDEHQLAREVERLPRVA